MLVMSNYLRVILLFPITFCLTGCFLYDDPDLSECPTDVRIELQWKDCGPIDENENVVVKVYSGGGMVLDTISNIYGIHVALAPAEYEVVGWEPYRNVTIEGHTISLSAERYDRTLPVNIFSAGMGTGTIVPSVEHQVIYLPMRRQVRELIVIVEFTGNLAPGVASMKGDLGGVALSREIENGFPPESGRQRPYAISRTDAIYDFTRGIRDNGRIGFTASDNLIGIDGDSDQILNLQVGFSDGGTASYPIDITGLMTGFHTVDVCDPWYVILQVNMSLDMLITIEDWYGGTESYLVAE